MINYAKILKQKEKDNPIPFLRASYLFSNVGDLVKCYGRSLRFPEDRKLYEAEMKLALADIVMQCEMAGHEGNFDKDTNNIPITQPWTIGSHYDESDKEIVICTIASHATKALEYIRYYDKRNGWRFNEGQYPYYICETYRWAGRLCKIMNWDLDDIRHLGFLHIMERYEQFEREGWKLCVSVWILILNFQMV
jgi:hypothetical protein